MPRHHPAIPRFWLMTDERMGDALWTALARLPRGAGVVFRHYSLPYAARRALFEAVTQVARRRGLIVIRAGKEPFRGEHGAHNQGARRHRGIKTCAAHNAANVAAATRQRADAIFISPVFPSRSHPDTRSLGTIRAARLARGAKGRAIALGGMNARRYAMVRAGGFIGYAAIDAWATPQARATQKRSAVPT